MGEYLKMYSLEVTVDVFQNRLKNKQTKKKKQK